MAYLLSVTKAINHAPTDLKKELKDVFSGIKEDSIFADNSWKKTTLSTWKIKTSAENVTKIGNKVPSATMTPGKFLKATISGYKIDFLISGKKSGSKGGGDAASTRMQELGSAWIMRRAIVDNKKYPTADSIRQDPQYVELVAIYPDVDEDDEWLQTFYGQQKKMLEEFGQQSFKEFNREGGFMKFISDLCRDKFGIAKKDTWNPADIWCIKNEDKNLTIIKNVINGTKKSQTILELNQVLIRMFNDREIVGISLKKLSDKIAKYEEFNVGKSVLPKDFDFNIFYEGSKIDLSFANKKFGTQDTTIKLKEAGVLYKIQIKGNDTSTICNLKYESTAEASSAARVGKAAVDQVAALLIQYGLKFVNNNKLYPQNAKEFQLKKSTYIKMYNAVNGSKFKIVKPPDQKFEDNIIKGYTYTPSIAVSKLMQLHFLSELMSLPDKKRNYFMTDMIFLSAKIGENFGPFGKLY